MKTFARIAAVVSAVVVLLVIIVGVVWIATRPGYSAVALLKVSSVRPTIAFDVAAAGEEVTFDVYRQSQMAAVTSIFVIQAALREPDVAQSFTLAQHENPISWLQRNLHVEFPNNGEYMAIALNGNDPDELEQIVNAVKDAYYEEVVLKERKEKQVTFDRLQRVWQQTLEDIREESQRFRNLAESLGSAQSDTAEASRTLAFRELEMLVEQHYEVASKLCDVDLALQVNAARQNLIEDWEETETAPQDETAERTGVAVQRSEVDSGEQSAPESKEEQGPHVNDRDTDQEESPKLENDNEEQLRKLKSESEVLVTKLKHYQTRLNDLQQRRSDLEARLLDLSRHNVELDERKARLEGLREIANVMQTKLERWRIELDAPPRVQQVQNAISAPLTWWGEEDEETSDLPDYSAY